jgi:hypothetical protein
MQDVPRGGNFAAALAFTAVTALQLRSRVRESGELELSLVTLADFGGAMYSQYRCA